MDDTQRRRRFLSLLGGSLTAGLAGCNTLTGTSPGDAMQNGDDTRSGDTNTDISVSISTEAQPGQLPSIWDDQSIEEFQARFSIQSSGNPTQVTVRNGIVQLSRDSSQWQENSVTVQPGQMQPGEQQFKATASKNDVTADDTAKVSKPLPGNYKLDVVPEKNQELRKTITNNSDEENYLADRGGFTQEDPVFDTYSSHEHVGFDKLGVDLVALEWRHDNDYEELSPDPKTDPNIETTQFIQSIGTDTGDPEIQALKNGNAGTTWYPNGDIEERDAGSFQYEKFANAETVGEALDQLHPYLFCCVE